MVWLELPWLTLELVENETVLEQMGTGGQQMHSQVWAGGRWGRSGCCRCTGGIWDPELSVEVSGLPLLVGVCQLEWSHGSSIASPEQFSIDFHCSS